MKLNTKGEKVEIQHGKFFVELWKDVKDEKDFQDRITIKALGKQITLYRSTDKESIVISVDTPNCFADVPTFQTVVWIRKKEK